VLTFTLEEVDAEMGEIIITAISSSMYTTGCGFNTTDSDSSDGSQYKADRDKLDLNAAWISKHSPYFANCEAQGKIVQDDLDYRERIVAETEELEEQGRELDRKIQEAQQRLEEKERTRLEVEVALLEAAARGEFDEEFVKLLQPFPPLGDQPS